MTCRKVFLRVDNDIVGVSFERCGEAASGVRINGKMRKFKSRAKQGDEIHMFLTDDPPSKYAKDGPDTSRSSVVFIILFIVTTISIMLLLTV